MTPLPPPPTYAVGDYLTIYCGSNEGCCFTVRAIRRAPATAWHGERWEYDAGAYGWRSEKTVCTEGYARMSP